MKYKGIELEEVTEVQLFDPPKEMLLWDNKSNSPTKDKVLAIVDGEREFRVITRTTSWHHCAEIPEEPKKPVTNSELSQWLAKGNGYIKNTKYTNMVYTNFAYEDSMADEPIEKFILIRKWKDTEWHKPTREYLGLED